MKKISVVVPCYNEEESLPAFYEEINRVSETMKKTNFEFIFINDGSKDNTLNILREYAKKDKRVRYISFSRNFFKEAGLYAGLKESTGDYVVVMDADLQDPPALLPQMVDFSGRRARCNRGIFGLVVFDDPAVHRKKRTVFQRIHGELPQDHQRSAT